MSLTELPPHVPLPPAPTVSSAAPFLPLTAGPAWRRRWDLKLDPSARLRITVTVYVDDQSDGRVLTRQTDYDATVDIGDPNGPARFCDTEDDTVAIGEDLDSETAFLACAAVTDTTVMTLANAAILDDLRGVAW